MNANATLSRRPRAASGLGLADASLDAREQAIVRAMLWSVGATFEERPVRRSATSACRARVEPPPSLATQFSATPLDRLNHSGGKSYADLARMWMRTPPATRLDRLSETSRPSSTSSTGAVGQRRRDPYAAAAASARRRGGGGTGYAGVVSLDLERLNRVLEVDPVSRAARIQGGALGPELAAQLKPRGLTLRHFPQSFEFSSLGGWIATRAAALRDAAHAHR